MDTLSQLKTIFDAGYELTVRKYDSIYIEFELTHSYVFNPRRVIKYQDTNFESGLKHVLALAAHILRDH